MKPLVLSLLFLLSQEIFSKKITLASTKSMPPYLYLETKTGIEYEIVIEALKAVNLINVVHMDIFFKRAIVLLKAKKIDIITSNYSNKSYESFGSPVFSSNTTLNYIDCAISLKSNNFKLEKIKSFNYKKIWAFKSASRTLGKKFHQMTLLNKLYSENFKQEDQASALLSKRIDIAISDKNIFLSSLKALGIPKDKRQLFNFHSIGKPTKRVVRFYDKELRDQFNRGLEIIKENGVYKRIRDKYSALYFEDC